MPSVTRRSSPSPSRQTDTRRRILEGAERLLNEGEPFTTLGVQRFVEEAGVARSSFYAHFDDKTQLLLALARELSMTAHDAHATWSATADDALDEMVEGFVTIVAHYRHHARVLAAVLEVAGYDPLVATQWDAELTEFRTRVEVWLDIERKAGRTGDSVDTESAARLIVDGGMRAIADQVIRGDKAGDRRFAEEMGRLWWYGAFRRP